MANLIRGLSYNLSSGTALVVFSFGIMISVISVIVVVVFPQFDVVEDDTEDPCSNVLQHLPRAPHDSARSIISEQISSAGLGGTVPEVSTWTPLGSCFLITSSISVSLILLARIVLRPRSLSSPKIVWRRGRRMSASRTTTLAPVCSRINAVLT